MFEKKETLDTLYGILTHSINSIQRDINNKVVGCQGFEKCKNQLLMIKAMLYEIADMSPTKKAIFGRIKDCLSMIDEKTKEANKEKLKAMLAENKQAMELISNFTPEELAEIINNTKE